MSYRGLMDGWCGDEHLVECQYCEFICECKTIENYDDYYDENEDFFDNYEE